LASIKPFCADRLARSSGALNCPTSTGSRMSCRMTSKMSRSTWRYRTSESSISASRFQFALALNAEKTRLIEFGKYAAKRRAGRGERRPETFNFLGFTHVCAERSDGGLLLCRYSQRDRMRATLRNICDELRRRWHDPIAEQGQWLRRVVAGYFAYHAVPTNIHALHSFREHVAWLWMRRLRRRSQTSRMTWSRFNRLCNHWLPPARILHPYPQQRFAVKHPR
jgi:RNA-directed DNA polymerase